MNVRPILAPALMAVALFNGGCAAMRNVDSDVSSYSHWPADRKPATYSFERLPSQQDRPAEQDALEAAARDALAAAGFTEATDPAASDVTVQLGLRIGRSDRPGWDDPFYGAGFYGGGLWGGHYGYRRRFGASFDLMYDSPRYDREVAVLIRDRKTGQPVYETRASNDGGTQGDAVLYAAMFTAALKDFPQPAVNPRRVTVPTP